MSEFKKSQIRSILEDIGTPSAKLAIQGKIPFISVKGTPDKVEKLLNAVLTDDNGIYNGEPGYAG